MNFTVVKTTYGFEYRVGQLVIARGEFVKRNNEWKLKLWHMQSITDTRAGIATCGARAVLSVSEVFPYLNNLIYNKPEETTHV
jgi:hypothetical protein